MTAVNLFQTPLRATWDVSNNLTETFWWPAKEYPSSKRRIVFLMIPGNPGVIDWYQDFLQQIHDECKFGMDIIGVSHLGHTIGEHNPKKNWKRLYSLREQVEHKIQCFDLLRNQFSQDTEFIIAGHSVGAWIATQVLKERPNNNIKKIIALFPTLRDIAETPNGTRMTPLFTPFNRSVMGLLTDVISFLPSSFLKGLVKLATGQTEPALTVTATRMLHGSVVRNALFLAGQEMETIKDLDHDLFETHFEKYFFYYGRADEWAPIEHHDDMKSRFPEGKILLCEDGLPHAFVLEHSDIMGEKVAGWLNDMYVS